MELPASIYQRIVIFLGSLPNLHDTDSQRAFIYQAGLDPQLRDQIPFGKPLAQFIPLLVDVLLGYGTLKDGRFALEALLETSRNSVGHDKKIECDLLIKEVRPILGEQLSPSSLLTDRPGQKFLKHSLFPIILFLMIIVIGVMASYNKFFQEFPVWAIETPYIHPEASLSIIAENKTAQLKAPLNIKWDDLVFLKAAIPDPDPNIFRWSFTPKDVIAPEDMRNGRHQIEVSLAGVSYSQSFRISINDEAPIVEAAIESTTGNPDIKILKGIAASKLQDPDDVLEVDVFFNHEGQNISIPLPVTRVEDEEGRIYFKFETSVGGLPQIPENDPRYDAPFFAFQVTDQAGNKYYHILSYAQFIAPGQQLFGVNRVADIRIQQINDTSSNNRRFTVAIHPALNPESELQGEPTIHLIAAKLHGTNFRHLTWISDIDRDYKEPLPTLVYRNGQNLAIVLNSDTYTDKNPILDDDSVYQIQKIDKDGRSYISNAVSVPSEKQIGPPPSDHFEDPQISIDNITAYQGQSVLLNVFISNFPFSSAAQIVIRMPDAIFMEDVVSGDLLDNFTVSTSSLTAGVLKIVIYTSNGQTFFGDGMLLTLSAKVYPNTPPGRYPITFSSSIFTDVVMESIPHKVHNGFVEVLNTSIPGDLNGDFTVDNADMEAILDCTQGKKQCQGYDLNNDNVVDIEDLLLVVKQKTMGRISIDVLNKTLNPSPNAKLDLSITTSDDGYLWIFDYKGESMYQLIYPNPTSQELQNEIFAGTSIEFPDNNNVAIFAGDNAGQEHLLFIVTSNEAVSFALQETLQLSELVNRVSLNMGNEKWGIAGVAYRVE